jgi:hypothetical protein
MTTYRNLTATRILGQSQRNGQPAMEDGGYAFMAAEKIAGATDPLATHFLFCV